VDMTDVRRIHGAFSGSADPKVRSAVRLVKGFIDSEGRSLPGAEEDDATDASTSASSVF
jgi:hypothetical protein